MTAEIIWGTDFRTKQIRRSTPQQELERYAREIMDVIWNGHDRAIYESSIGYISDEKEPA